jgi:maleate isomerase
MYGWRARLGLLTASGIIAPESEFWLMAPEGVSCHFTKMPFTGGGTKDIIEELKTAEKFLEDAVTLIADAHPSAVALVGTGASFAGGYGYDQKLIQKMKERIGNLPATTGSSSAIAALKKLGVKKISMAMPYVEDVARVGREFVEANGIKVLNAKWLGKRDSFEIAQIPRETIYSLAKEADEPESEAVFISCVALFVVELIEILEHDLKKPVVTTNQAIMWNLLRMVKVNDKIEGFGQLLSKY